jgi:hypothetical protein
MDNIAFAGGLDALAHRPGEAPAAHRAADGAGLEHPDIDIVTALGGGVAYLGASRMHARTGRRAGDGAAADAGGVAILRTRVSVLAACWVTCCSTGSNIYGVRMLLPFSSAWLRLDITDVIDP